MDQLNGMNPNDIKTNISKPRKINLTELVHQNSYTLAIYAMQDEYAQHKMTSFPSPSFSTQPPTLGRQYLLNAGYITSNKGLDTINLSHEYIAKELLKKYNAIQAEKKSNQKLWHHYQLRRKTNSTALVFGLTVLICWIIYFTIIPHVPFLRIDQWTDLIYGAGIPLIASLISSFIYKHHEYNKQAKYGALKDYVQYFNQQAEILKNRSVMK